MCSLFDFIMVKKLEWLNTSISFISFLKELSAKGVYSHFDLNSKIPFVVIIIGSFLIDWENKKFCTLSLIGSLV
jgi:hypothetical protein